MDFFPYVMNRHFKSKWLAQRRKAREELFGQIYFRFKIGAFLFYRPSQTHKKQVHLQTVKDKPLSDLLIKKVKQPASQCRDNQNESQNQISHNAEISNFSYLI